MNLNTILRNTARRNVRRGMRRGARRSGVLALLAIGLMPLVFLGAMFALFHPDSTFRVGLPSIPPSFNEGVASHDVSLERAFVYRVIDGDTIKLSTGEDVRLIGVDAPEMGFYGSVYEEGATGATIFVRELIEGRYVYLEADGENLCRWGRLRRYVWIAYPSDPNCEYEIREKMLNAILLQEGFAEVAIYGTPKHKELFRELYSF